MAFCFLLFAFSMTTLLQLGVYHDIDEVPYIVYSSSVKDVFIINTPNCNVLYFVQLYPALSICPLSLPTLLLSFFYLQRTSPIVFIIIIIVMVIPLSLSLSSSSLSLSWELTHLLSFKSLKVMIKSSASMFARFKFTFSA